MNSNELVNDHIVFAEKIAANKKKSLPSHIDFDELKSAAYLGLVKASRKFNDSKGVSFTTYAFYRISGEIDDYLRKFHRRAFQSLQDNLDIPKSPKVCSIANFFEKFEKKLSQKMFYVLTSYFCDNKSLKEIGEELKVSESRVSQILTQCKDTIRDNFSGEQLWEELLAA